MENLEIDKNKEKSILQILNDEIKYKKPPPLKRQKAFDSYLYKILIKFVSKLTSNLICLIFTCFPINIYGSVQVSSIILQIFLILSFLLMGR